MRVQALSAEEIAKPIADIVAALALNSQPSEWCHSVLFPLGYFDRKVIKTVKVVGGLRRVTVPFEIVRVDFNVLNMPPLANEVRRLLHLMMLPLLKGSRRVLKNTPEGIVILLGENGQTNDDHESPVFAAPAEESLS
jgi:hypothetical protein